MSKVQTQRSQFIMIFFAFSFGMILSNLLGQAKEPQEETSEAILVYRGFDKTIADLPEEIAEEYQTLTEQTLKKRKALLYTAALTWQLEEYAAIEALSIEEAGDKLFGLSPPTDQEINAFYVSQADKIEKPFYEVKEKIHQHLIQKQALQARHDKIAELIEKGDLALLIE